MAYLLEIEANGLRIALPSEKQVIEDKWDVEELIENSLWAALARAVPTEDADWDEKEEARMLLREWIARLSNAGIWMPEECNINAIVFNLKMADMFSLLTADTEFPLTLEEELTDEEEKELLDWEAITAGLTQAEPDWM